MGDGYDCAGESSGRRCRRQMANVLYTHLLVVEQTLEKAIKLAIQVDADEHPAPVSRAQVRLILPRTLCRHLDGRFAKSMAALHSRIQR